MTQPIHINATQLLNHEDIYRLIMEHTRDLIRVIDRDLNYVYVSPSHETTLGYMVEEIVHTSVLNLLHPDDRDTAIAMHRQMVTDDVTMDGLFRFQCKTGAWITLETRGRSLVKEGQIVGVVTVGRDVTERLRMEQALKESEAQLRFLAFHDFLTGLPNRRQLVDDTSQALHRASLDGSGVGLLMVDCDNFKAINDAYGHEMGDDAIKELARRLTVAVGTHGTVARMGGDEFIALVPHASRQHVVDVVDRVLRSTHSVWDVNGYGIHLTVSIGAALAPTDATDAQTLFHCADDALYEAKQQGKNRCVFFESRP